MTSQATATRHGIGETGAPETVNPSAGTAGLQPLALPTGTGRVAALAAAVVAGTTTAGALGAVSATWTEVALLTSGALLLLVAAIALGLQARAILLFAFVTALVAAPVAASAEFSVQAAAIRLLVLLPAVVAATFLWILWRVPDARSVLSGLLIGLLGALVCTAWPVLAVLGGYRIAREASALAIACVAGVAPLAWAAASFGRLSALRAGFLMAEVRDAAFRVVTLVAACAAALRAGTEVEHLVSAGTYATPLESLTPAAGWTAAIAILAVLVWSTWRLPGWLSALQLRGRIDADAVGEPLVFITLGCLAALAIWRIDDTTPPGSAIWVAVASGGAYAWCRLRYAAPVRTRGAPLWIVVAGGNGEAVGELAAEAAAAWKAGQVTVLAEPEAVSKVGGEHLHAAVRAGLGVSLFPKRMAHLEDWDDAQPDEWRALPVRELYAPGELWPQILSERVEPDARLLAIVLTPATSSISASVGDDEAEEPQDRDDTTPALAATIRRRAARIASRLLRAAGRAIDAPGAVALFVPRSNAPRLRANAGADDVAPLASEAASGKARLRERLRELTPAAAPMVVRHVLVLCPIAQGIPTSAQVTGRSLAERVVQLVHGERDRAGRIVEVWVGPSGSPSGTLRRLFRMSIGTWRHASVLIGRLLETSGPTGRLSRLFITLWLAVFGRGWIGEFELVVIESDGEAVAGTLPRELVARGLARGVVSRMVAVQPPGSRHALTYPASLYAGEIRVRPGAIDVAAADVAARLLALDLVAIPSDPFIKAVRRGAAAARAGRAEKKEEPPPSPPDPAPAPEASVAPALEAPVSGAHQVPVLPRPEASVSPQMVTVERLAGAARAADGLPWLLPRSVRAAINAFVARETTGGLLLIDGSADSAVGEVPEYVASLARDRLEVYVQVDLEPEMWPRGEELVRELAMRMDLDRDQVPTYDDLQSPARARRLAVWLLSTLAHRDPRRVLLVRGGESGVAPPETLDFLGALAHEIATRGGPLKMVLHECRQAGQWAPGHPTLRVAPIEREDLVACIRQAFEDRHVPFDAGKAAQAAELTEQFAERFQGAVVGRRHRGAELRHALRRAVGMVLDEADA